MTLVKTFDREFKQFESLINISGRIFADGVQIARFNDGLDDGGEFRKEASVGGASGNVSQSLVDVQ